MSERVLICGDRNWINFELILKELSKVQQEQGVDIVIEGGSQGADMLGKYAAERLGIPVLSFIADWRKYGRAAGPIRNRQQLNEGKPTIGLAFHNFIENSKGTKDMVNVLREAGIPVKIITEKGNYNEHI